MYIYQGSVKQSANRVPWPGPGVIWYFMLPPISLLLFMFIIIGAHVRHKRKRTDRITWIDNEIYSSDDTDAMIEFPKAGVA